MSAISTFVNLLALALSLGLGFYIITRSPHSRVSWLATLTLWSLATFFIHNSIAINLPGSGILPWLRQAAIIVLPLWFHLTTLLLPQPVVRSARQFSLSLVTMIGAYVIALILIAMGVFTRELLSIPANLPEIYTSRRLAGPFYPIYLVYFAAIASLSIRNLWRGRLFARDASLKQQFSLLFLASILVGLGALYLSLGVWLHLDLPNLPGDIAMGTGVILLGVAVARYNALLIGRQIERDFLYTFLAVGSLTLFYVLVTGVLYWGGQISFLTLVLTVIGTICFNVLYDGIRVALDRLFYHGHFDQLRANLRALAHEAGTFQTLSDKLQAILIGVCHTLRIRQGFIALKIDNEFEIVASLDSYPKGHHFPVSMLTENEIVGLVRPAQKGLEGMALIVPLFGGTVQIGAAVLGEKENKQPYSEQDYEFLDDLAEIAGVVHSLRMQEERIQTISAMVADYREREQALQLQFSQLTMAKPPAVEPIGEEEMIGLVEDGLRRLHDFSYLGEHALAKLSIVARRLKQNHEITSIDRGKAVNQVLLHALEKLRPGSVEPKSSAIPREWHPYIILRDSYGLGELNRDIMAKLYIGEGTFNRARRRALRCVAKTLIEMEEGTQTT